MLPPFNTEKLGMPQAYGSYPLSTCIIITELRERGMKLTGVPGSSYFGTSLGGLSPLPKPLPLPRSLLNSRRPSSPLPLPPSNTAD